jgi:hypothetical protein
MFCEVNFNAPKDRADANVRGEEKELEGVREEGDCGVAAFLNWRRSWRAFASAFSWVRTKLAKF